jgi:hypothetical protein
MKNFPKGLSRLLSILSAFILGAYVTQEYKFDQPVDFYRYCSTFLFGAMFYIHGNSKD